MTDPYHCQFCKEGVSLADVNVATDIALCRHCGKTMPFSAIAPIPGAAEIDLQNPPKAVRIEESSINGRTIIYRKISPMVFFLIPFTAFWSGMSMFGIYGKQIKSGHFDLVNSLFGLPFLFGTVVLISIILYSLFGRTRIAFPSGMLTVATELGPIAWTRRLACDRSARVSLQMSNTRVNNVPQRVIQVDCQGRTLKFGVMMSDDAKSFIAEAVRRTLAGE
jgi:hypothetical protein